MKFLNHLSRSITLRSRISIHTLSARAAFLFIMIAKQNRKEKMNNEGIMKLTQVKRQQVKCIMVYLKSLKIGSKAENIQVSLIMVKNLILILENSIMICLREFID